MQVGILDFQNIFTECSQDSKTKILKELANFCFIKFVRIEEQSQNCDILKGKNRKTSFYFDCKYLIFRTCCNFSFLIKKIDNFVLQ